MATVYKIEIITVSPFVNYTPQDMERIVREALENNQEQARLENTEIVVARIA